MKVVKLIFVVLVGLSGPRTACAQAEDIPTYDLKVGAGLGASQSQRGFGVVQEGHALLRASIFGIGAHAKMAAVPGLSLGSGVDAGLVWRTHNLRFDLLGRFGVSRFVAVGSGLLSSDPGAEATLPFAGGSLTAGYLWKMQRAVFLMPGICVFVERDLKGRDVTYSYEDSSWLGGETETVIETRHVGWTRSAVMLTLDVQFDLN